MTDEIKKSEVALREEKILEFWKEKDIFKKSLDKNSPKGNYVFYDGPPFATGLPHYGHLLPGTVKDVIPRYKTMRGFHVERRWGWDTHGLPIENLVEKELGLKTKTDIEEYGIDKFNQVARDSVFRYEKQWKKIIPRTGRWVDMDNSYSTMSPHYTESVWWAFSELNKKGLLNEGFKSMHLCPRCETTLSNFEVNQGYKDITDLSVYAKFELIERPGTFVLAWTTTPWTLPGNVALAINENIKYIEVEHDGSNYILADNLAEKVLGVEEKILSKREVLVSDLIGQSYKPVFNYYEKDDSLENKENAWKIYSADFVNLDDGTGVVHIAPAFGNDDYELSRKENLPFIQHVNKNGTFKSEVLDFAGQKVKDKDEHQAADIGIIKHLAHSDLLFKKEKFIHSYPHCWRCDTPLLNYATSSWFVDVPKIRDQLVSSNENINWIPETIGKNRFGNWLKEAKEWAVSRSRFWGAPLPVWKSEDGEEMVIIGSVDELRDYTRSTNKYFVMRHGEADSNAKNIVSSDNSVPSNLTEKGKEEIKKTISELKNKGINLIITSPLNRTVQTASIVAKELGLDEKDILVDERIREINCGEFNGKSIFDYRAQFKDLEEKMYKASAGGGESVEDVRVRSGEFIYDIDKKYSDKNILVVTHEYVAWTLVANAKGLDRAEAIEIKQNHDDFISTGHVMSLDFAPIPHNEKYELDMHRPFIDYVIFSINGKKMERVKDVFDVWIDSGSVPFASFGYPFKKDINPNTNKGYPADLIAEGLDQTRGWFYTMLVLNIALFGKSPYKNVVVNGLVLAEDGRKMSKRLKNYPEVTDVIDKYGADSLRYFLMSSTAVKAEDLRFSEKGVDEVYKKIIMRLQNVVSFYEMYASDEQRTGNREQASEDVLDKWIIARLNEVKQETTNGMESYEVDRATRPFMDFIDDLSTWYLRRSRDRFKDEGSEDAKEALGTLRFVLCELAKLLAPFTPFIAEDVYQRVGGEKESVHLESWPITDGPLSSIKNIFKHDDVDIISDMRLVRETVTKALELRASSGIKVRQPLNTLFIKDQILADKKDLVALIEDEVNVKSVSFDATLDVKIKLDTQITEDLKREGDLRELIRFIQSIRKEMKLSPSDKVVLNISENAKGLVNNFEAELRKVTGIADFKFTGGDKTLELSDSTVNLSIEVIK